MKRSKKLNLSHFNVAGQAGMVDVSAKQHTRRTATASAFLELSAEVLKALPKNPKGDPLEVARFAGIQAAKRTSELIPMCHPLALTHVEVQADVVASGVRITATAATTGQTGVEMEVLTAAAVVAGSAVILFDPIFQGLAIPLMAGEVASLAFSRMTVPVVFFLMNRRRMPVVVDENV